MQDLDNIGTIALPGASTVRLRMLPFAAMPGGRRRRKATGGK